MTKAEKRDSGGDRRRKPTPLISEHTFRGQRRGPRRDTDPRVNYYVDRPPKPAWQYAVLLVAAATPILGYYGALNPEPHDRTNVNWEAIYWTIGVIVVAIAWFVVVLLLRPGNVRSAASHAAEHRGVAPLDERLDYEPLPENEMPL